MRFILFALIALLFAGNLYGATREEPAYRTLAAAPQWHWQDGLLVRFAPDEVACRKAYGNQWERKCAAPLGRPGHAAKGIELAPKAAGSWQWEGPYALRFVPGQAALSPGKSYTVDISGMALPAYISLRERKANVLAPRLSARLPEARFWIDPSPAGRHRILFALDFNYPVSESGFQPVLDVPKGALAGEMEAVWNAERDHVAISWPILKLAQDGGIAKLTLKGISKAIAADGDIQILPEGVASFSQPLPGRSEIFTIKSAKIIQEKDAALNLRYFLEIESSLYTDIQALAENILLVELPEFKSAETRLPYDWARAPAISAKDLERGRLLKVQTNAKGQQSRLRYQLPVQSGRHVFIGINNKIKSASGIALARPFTAIIHARPAQAQVGFLQPGHILAGNDETGVFGIGLDEIKWQIQLVDDPFLALVAATSSDSFAEPLEAGGLSMDNVARSVYGALSMKRGDDGEASYASLNPVKIMSEAFGESSGLARITLTGYKNGRQAAETSRLILATDMALMAKRSADGSLDCFASSLAGGKPLAEVTIDVAGANGRPVFSGKTDARGHIRFDSLAGLGREAKPVALIAKNGASLAWLPLNERAREIDYSAFDTAGRTGAGDALAYVFSQRGIYRPGDTLHFGCLPRRGDFSALPADLPLYGEIINPAGRRIWETRLSPGPEGIAEISWQSLPESIGGNYTFNVRIAREGDIIGSASARLETFQPDTLKMRVDNPAQAGWLVLNGQNLPRIRAELRNLYGAAAAGHKIRTELRAAPAIFRFDKFQDYLFTDPAPFIGAGINRKLPEATSDQAGQIQVTLPADLGSASASLTVACEGFDLSGARATGAATTFLVSPAERILGYRLTGSLTNPEFIAQGVEAKVELLAIDSQLAPVAWQNLQFSLLGRNYISNLVSDGNGGYRYDEIPQEIPLKSWTASLPSDGTAFSLPTQDVGEYLLKIRAADGSILLQLPYNVAGDRLHGPGEMLAGSKMRLRLPKKEFIAGEEIAVACALSYDASGLIAIERDKVEAFEWVDGHAGDNIFKIRVPDNFEGRGYITASFTRNEDSPLIYMNPLSWSACPFVACASGRDTGLRIVAPQKALPGSNLKVRLSAARPAKAILFAVDEGILQLTGWQNPRPVDALLNDRALAVKTMQVADLLMPSSTRIGGRFAAFGGGMDGGSPFGARFQNPFRRPGEPPVAFWSGLMPVSAETATIEIPIPAWYAGTIRIIAVGASKESAGSAVAQTAVAGPLTLTPQLPAFIASGDEFAGALVIANTTDKSADIALSMQLPESLQLVQGLPESARLPAGGELAAPFRIKSTGEPCIAKLQFGAAMPDYELQRETTLSIRPAAAMRTTLQAGLAIASGDLPPTRPVHPYNARSEIMASGIPIPLGLSLARYLETYPYGCTEQLLSRAFAILMLHNWPGANLDPAKSLKLLNAAVEAVASRFNGQYVALWPQGEGNLLLTAYAADFLLTLRESGLGNADALLENICDALRWNCSLNEPTLAAARACAYGLWALAREGRIVTQQLEELEAGLAAQGVEGWQEDITAALIAASKKEMAMDTSGDFRRIRLMPDGWFDDYGQQALLMALAARYYPESLAGLQQENFFDVSLSALNENSYSTWSAAQGLRALLALAGDAAPDLASVRVECLDPGSGFEATLDSAGKLLAGSAPQCSRYRLEPAAKPLYWQIATTGFDLDPTAQAQANGIEIERVYLDSEGNPLKEARLGDEIEVRITVRSSLPLLEDCVITDLLPGCLERIVTRQTALPEGIKYLDRQEDRTLIFANLQNQPLEFSYRCRVIAAGVFQVPAITAEAMYESGMTGNGQSSILRVGAE